MLTRLRIQNFKSWKDTGEIRLAPLTVIFGANSAGKSSLGHLMLALKQTALSTDRRRALDLGDESSLIDLGSYADAVHGHDLSLRLGFDLTWGLPKKLDVRNAIVGNQRFSGDSISLHSELGLDPKTGLLDVQELRYALSGDGGTLLSASVARTSTGKFDLKANPLKLVRNQGRGWPIEPPEKFYRLSERSLARYRNAGFLTDLALATEEMLRGLHYLGPLRETPRRMYRWSGSAPADVGDLGQSSVAALLTAQEENRTLTFGKGRGSMGLSEFIAAKLAQIGVVASFRVRPIAKDRRDYEVLVRTHEGAPEVKLTDVGIGVSQVLPAVVQAFYCPPNSTVWMEQPEIHLHPQVQAKLADVFIEAIAARERGAARNTQLIVESHSEHFLSRLQRRIAEGTLKEAQVAVYFARRVGQAAELEALRLNEDGEIENWPENFFGNQMAEIAGRVLARKSR